MSKIKVIVSEKLGYICNCTSVKPKCQNLNLTLDMDLMIISLSLFDGSFFARSDLAKRLTMSNMHRISQLGWSGFDLPKIYIEAPAVI